MLREILHRVELDTTMQPPESQRLKHVTLAPQRHTHPGSRSGDVPAILLSFRRSHRRRREFSVPPDRLGTDWTRGSALPSRNPCAKSIPTLHDFQLALGFDAPGQNVSAHGRELSYPAEEMLRVVGLPDSSARVANLLRSILTMSIGRVRRLFSPA